MLHVLFVILFAVALRLTAGQQPSQEQCQSLLNVSSCQPWGNCSGLQCPGKGSIVVFKCQDPVVVQLTVNGTSTRNVTQSSVFTGQRGISIQRDTDSLFFNATVDGAVVVPNVAVPLNTSYCACRSLQQLSIDAQSASVLQLSCSTNVQCTGVRCVPTLPSLFGVDLTVLPCRDPPAVQISLVDTSGYAVLYNGTFDRSQNVSVSPLLTLSVEITPRQYSMDVGVSVSTPVYGTIPIFVKRTIILDKSTCSLPPVPANPTCQALQNLRTRLPLCSLNQACNGLNCAVLGAPYTVAFEVQPCTQPPSIFVTVRDQASGVVVYNSSVNDSTAVSLGPNVSLSIVLKQLPSAIGLKVDLLLQSRAANLVPFYVIPIDQSQCGFGSGSEPCFSEIGNATSICAANPSCDGVTCSLPGGLVTRVGVLPCNTPPAISLTVQGANGTVLFSRAIDRTQQVPLVGGASLLVVVNQLPNATIGFQVDLQTLVGTTNIIPYTTFPLNTTGCGPTQVPPTLSPQQPGTACAALSGIASSQPLCSTNVACDQIDCSVQGYTTAMTVLPCTSPPSVRLTVTNPVGTQVYSQTLSQSRQVSILGGVLGLQVTVDQLDNALGIKLDVTTPFGTSNIIPFTVVPLNTSSCPPTQAPPTSSPETTTCSALRGVSSFNPTCLANEACNGLTCTTLGLSTGFTILPCNSPPAIALSVNGSNGTVLYSGVISGSQFIPLGGTVTLVIVVGPAEQLTGNQAARMEGSSDVESDLVGEVFEYLLSQGQILRWSVKGKKADDTEKKALKFSVSSRGELFYRPKRKGKANMCSSCKHLYGIPFWSTLRWTGPSVTDGNDVADKADNSADEMGEDAAQTPRSVADNADNSADGSIIEISNHTVDTVLYLPVDALSAFGGVLSIIPYTVIPLNTSNCGPTQATPTTSPLLPTTTCSALQSIPLTTGGRSCSVRPTCDQLDCTVLGYTASFVVLPCNSPPAVSVMVNSSANATLFYQVVSTSQRVPLFGLTALDITVVQLNNSIGFKVDIIPLPGLRVPLIPYTVIPLNVSNCGPTRAPPTPIPPTDTCGALSTITSLNAACTPTPALSHHGGPAERARAPRGGSLLANAPPSRIEVMYYLVFLSLDVVAITPIGTSIIIPYTVIPLNTSNCASVPTQVPTSPLPDTCSALRSIATSGQYCSATALCDGVDCQYLNYRIRMRLLPCSNPPSIALTAYDQTTGTVYYNQTLSQSQKTTLVNGFLSLDVTLLQRRNAIILQVDLVPIAGPRINIIPYTLIPVSTAGCSSTQAPSTSRTPPSSQTTSPPTTQNGGTATQAQAAVDSRKVAIAVPVTVILILLAVVVVVVVVVVFVVRKYLKRKTMHVGMQNIYGIQMGDDHIISTDK
eukprot:Em0012g887a